MQHDGKTLGTVILHRSCPQRKERIERHVCATYETVAHACSVGKN